MTARPIGIAHLTLLDLTPPEMVTTAAAAGYDFVGIRVKAATAGETPFPMEPGSVMSKETQLRLADTGLTVRDIEFLTLDAHVTADDWLPALAAGAALGASTISVVGADPDRGRLLATLALLVEHGREFGIRPTLEPISYQPVSTVEEAAELARATGAAVLLDPLHIQRGGNTVDQVRALEASLVPILQLCDAPFDTPAHLDVPTFLPRGMTTNGSVLQLEARAVRLPAGTGGLPLAELLGAVAPETPLSVEVPNGHLRATLDALSFARLNREAVDRLLESLTVPAV
ncbi:sugar phosphate isomerase/epimerase [Cryobacterium frigoriphilum]|uniref:Sugar phosphate isomerase/epimerase n=1 Tax=Cryobacterium frigoriphilum TaxID=1259150 RepID=A0A4R9A925_9MICO|nr:TIM barrel protein [Cryobacterium frigoriphilum]TFD54473.1 sugar phosphate isomerase/epimerase [Cryobacterium frigoriphilum]